MIDLLTIQTIGVIAAAFTLALNALNTIRVSNEESKKRKIEFTNNIMRTLYTEEGWRQVQRELEVEAALGVGLPAGVPLVARLLARLTGQIKTGRECGRRSATNSTLKSRFSLRISTC